MKQDVCKQFSANNWTFEVHLKTNNSWNSLENAMEIQEFIEKELLTVSWTKVRTDYSLGIVDATGKDCLLASHFKTCSGLYSFQIKVRRWLNQPLIQYILKTVLQGNKENMKNYEVQFLV